MPGSIMSGLQMSLGCRSVITLPSITNQDAMDKHTFSVCCLTQEGVPMAGGALPCRPWPCLDTGAVTCCRAVSVLQHLAFVSPNAAELVAMAQALHAAQQRRPDQTFTSSQPPLPPLPPPPPQYLQPPQQVCSSLQQSQQQQGAEAGSEARGLLQRLAPHMAIMLQVSAVGVYA